MYRHDDHTLIGYPYAAQPNISPECITSAYSREPWIDYTTGYDNVNAIGNEGIGHVSPTDLTPSLLPQSVLQKNTNINTNNNTTTTNNNNNNGWFSRMGLVYEAESENNLVRRVFSTGDLQINAGQGYSRSESPLSSESSSIIESMSRAYPYSPEEKKERIERYRTKRSQRNFTKKIKYECRKTLADSRPRVRGRFARNDEIEKSSQSSQWSHECLEEDDVDQYNWLNFLDSFPANLIS